VKRGTGAKAFLFAFTAVSLFSLEAAFARAIGPGIDLAQIGVIRAVLQFAFLWAWLGSGFGDAFITNRASMHVTRGLLSVTGLAAYFFVFANLPMATATVISFAGVLVTTVAAQVILREQVGWARWSATIVGFAGVLIVLRPGAVPFDWVLLVGLYMAANGAAINLATKGLTRTERTPTIMIWISLMTILVSLPVAVVTFTQPTGLNLAYMIGIGVTGTLGQFASISAYRHADVSAIAPVLYFRIVIATAIGNLVFAETLHPLTILGAAVVTASALYITMSESRFARERAPD
jgi:drug/metabolite transporter (DMT)-like permease